MADGAQLIVPLAAAVVPAALAVPSTTTNPFPVTAIVDLVPVAGSRRRADPSL